MSKLRGRFDRPPDEAMQRFSSSVHDDLPMLDEDIDGSIAHATMLGEVGLITSDEATEIAEALAEIRLEFQRGEMPGVDEADDIHMAVEQRLVALLGETGKKLHTARSRNDQVATDVRLWLKRKLAAIDAGLVQLTEALLDRVEGDDGRVLMPGYTHLQRGQPILLGHHLLAHAGALARDRERLAGARTRVDRSPLGACAMAGTSHPIDRQRAAELLGFGGLVENAMDAVAARDHQQEVAAVCAIAMTHLSRMAEELVLWSSSEFAFVRLPDEYTTGSSIMPQKRNPDAAELIRGKAARAQGCLTTLMGLTRSLPLAYNRDLQEDRVPLFDVVETLEASLHMMAGMWRGLRVERERFATALVGDFSLATEIADLLAQLGVPFREAHEVVGRIVLDCERRGEDLSNLTSERAREFHPQLDIDLSGWLDPRAAAERRTSRGGTASTEIRRQADLLRRSLAARS